jgi:hypothetical protein
MFSGIKATGALGSQPYHLHVPIVLNSGRLNLLEPSGPVQACNGTVLSITSLESQQCLQNVNVKGSCPMTYNMLKFIEYLKLIELKVITLYLKTM